jgi:hypothetical protein
MKFELFDSVKLTEEISLSEGGVAPTNSYGAIVEVFKDGEAYMVELFGNWVKYNDEEYLVPATRDEKGSFIETIGIETLYPHQLELVAPARDSREIRASLQALLDDLSEDLVAQVRDFAEFLREKQKKATQT